jgi:chromate transporter
VAPVLLAAVLLGPSRILTQIGLFFATRRRHLREGAYALLVWLAQAAVEQKVTAAEWRTASPKPASGRRSPVRRFRGLADARALSPMLAAVLGEMTTWVTFAPLFLSSSAGAPFVEDLRHNRLLGALKGHRGGRRRSSSTSPSGSPCMSSFGRVGSLPRPG